MGALPPTDGSFPLSIHNNITCKYYGNIPWKNYGTSDIRVFVKVIIFGLNCFRILASFFVSNELGPSTATLLIILSSMSARKGSDKVFFPPSFSFWTNCYFLFKVGQTPRYYSGQIQFQSVFPPIYRLAHSSRAKAQFAFKAN